MAHLRQQVQHSCLVGCVGEVNAGKTTLIRVLLGLDPEPEAHRTENATSWVAAASMPPYSSAGGAATTPGSPVLIDTGAAKSMPWSDENLKQVIAQFTPVLHLHHKELYLPCSVEWFFERSQLWLVEPVENVSLCTSDSVLHSHHC